MDFKDLNVRSKTIKTPRIKQGKSFRILDLAMIYWIEHQNLKTKAKINKWDYIKLKNSCVPKEKNH